MRRHKPDYLIIAILGSLVIFGLVVLASASSNLGQAKFGDSFYYLKHQALYGLTLGIAGFIVAFRIYYRHYQKFAVIFLIVSIAALILVFTPLGLKVGGAERWVKIGPLTVQPAEILKITFILYLAAWLSGPKERYENIKKGFLPFLLVIIVIAALLIKQPSTASVFIIIATAIILYFTSGAKLRYIIGVGVLGIAALATVVYFTPYRLERIVNYLQPGANPLAGGYHINQAQIAIGSGGLFGVGYGQSTTKISYLPEPIGDSIFAVIAEEMGFVGSILLIAAFMLLIYKTFTLAKKTRDRFGKLILVGFGSLIGIQVFVNIAAISGLIPLTGVPLPFISYGGTALAVFMTMGGVIANVSRYS
ncbi:MAG: Cell division protein FtsW [Parcubacteria group bacterium GW2011_GWA2_47_8b]|uniref:Probable peptidoglycan glycosyltransferase FtsW n=3 Tax=Parcubacteria group TaxID=1794811 RepID=A0A0G1T614_9BACT|nr:MAG: Cell division protein FtsW [Candidatus Giovannonibacteria bacterium GW2011_GWB1_47_6b]KKU83799.1 MAG: Cell division protein FtsW [Parcubacteria group bacterium GW2011_GWA2_47_8b]KKU95006.1 MAG: Cell division protein FtsW [Parcubacteria group bacterium GW2011_GWA1_48_11b]OGY63513.1 MAG: hypothetical protein A3E64_02460 [Candidatus Harrisonbacteria bacterium RIFCSPHIGHO2_12_FULL_48_16]OGY68280.1 MAG: hypothetical protein A2214_02315 [Candidatus Harrisonbacteria bacterium RIFOXYA1_FULL_48_